MRVVVATSRVYAIAAKRTEKSSRALCSDSASVSKTDRRPFSSHFAASFSSTWFVNFPSTYATLSTICFWKKAWLRLWSLLRFQLRLRDACGHKTLRYALFEVRWRNGRSAMVPGPQAWEEAGSARWCGAVRQAIARRGETNVVRRSEARPTEERRRAVRRDGEVHGGHACTRCAHRRPLCQRVCRVARARAGTRVHARVRSSTSATELEHARKRDRWRRGEASQTTLLASVTSSEKVLYDWRRWLQESSTSTTHTHTLTEFHICAHTRYGKREREGERVYGKDKRTKRVRTMYTRYDSMTYMGKGAGSKRRSAHRRDVNRISYAPDINVTYVSTLQFVTSFICNRKYERRYLIYRIYYYTTGKLNSNDFEYAIKWFFQHTIIKWLKFCYRIDI